MAKNTGRGKRTGSLVRQSPVKPNMWTKRNSDSGRFGEGKK